MLMIRRPTPFLMVTIGLLIFATVAYGLNDYLFFGTVLVFGHFMMYSLAFKVMARFSLPGALWSNSSWKGNLALIAIVLAFAALFYWYSRDLYDTASPLALALISLVDLLKSLQNDNI